MSKTKFRKRKTVIPVACFFGETSTRLTRELSKQARGDPDFTDVKFTPVKTKRLKGFQWHERPEPLLALAREAPVVIASHAAACGIRRMLAKLEDPPTLLEGLLEHETAADKETAAARILAELRHYLNLLKGVKQSLPRASKTHYFNTEYSKSNWRSDDANNL